MTARAWATDEVEYWLLHDEDMRDQVTALARSRKLIGRTQYRARLRAWCKEWAKAGRFGMLIVAGLADVDWEQVADVVYVAATENKEAE